MARVPLWTLVIVPALVGCYSYVPLGGTRPETAPGARVAIELTDEGRVGMAPQVGPEADRIEGKVLAQSDSAYELGVSMLIGLYGAESKWSGEKVAVRKEYVRRLTVRRFSAWRTAVAVGSVSAAVLTFVLTRSLLGGGSGPDTAPPPPPNNN